MNCPKCKATERSRDDSQPRCSPPTVSFDCGTTMELYTGYIQFQSDECKRREQRKASQ